jgi:dTDP-4-dehydrorhamnose reductase
LAEGRVLIIGLGFLGRKMVKVFQAHGFQVFSADLSDGQSLELDMTDHESVQRVFEEAKPEVVVLTAGLTNVDACEENPEQCLKVNVKGTANVVEACRRFKAKMIFISTDFVFDGEKGDYLEDDPAQPLNVYGRSKLEAEKIVASLPGHLILRTSTLYGFNGLDDKTNFVKWVIAQLKEGNKIKVVSDQITSPTLIDDLAEAIARLIEQKEEGVFHAVGCESLSRYDFAKKIIEVFELDESLLEETDSRQFVQKAKRPKDSSLNNSKLESKGISMRGCFPGLQEMRTQMHSAGQ